MKATVNLNDKSTNRIIVFNNTHLHPVFPHTQCLAAWNSSKSWPVLLHPWNTSHNIAFSPALTKNHVTVLYHECKYLFTIESLIGSGAILQELCTVLVTTATWLFVCLWNSVGGCPSNQDSLVTCDLMVLSQSTRVRGWQYARVDRYTIVVAKRL